VPQHSIAITVVIRPGVSWGLVRAGQNDSATAPVVRQAREKSPLNFSNRARGLTQAGGRMLKTRDSARTSSTPERGPGISHIVRALLCAQGEIKTHQRARSPTPCTGAGELPRARFSLFSSTSVSVHYAALVAHRSPAAFT
jgi:hypothetical protein